MSGWQEIYLEDVCEKIYSGGTPDTRNSTFWNGNVPWLSSGETRNKFITKTDKMITDAGIKNSSTRLANIGSIVIASAGQGHTRGQTSYLEMNTYINQSVVCLKPDPKKVDSLWLFYNLSNRYDEMRQISDSHSSRGSLTTALLKKMKVFVPPKQLQETASQSLYAIDRKIELNQRMNETLEAMARVLFKSWFVDFDPVRAKAEGRKPEGIDAATAVLFPATFNDDGLPEGWKSASVGEITDKIFSGGTPSTQKPEYWGGEYKWFSSGETRSKYVIDTEKTITKAGVEESSTKLSLAGDILIASAGQGHTRGQTSLSFFDAYINQSVVAVRANPDVCGSIWLFYDLEKRYNEMRSISDSHSSRGSLTTKLIASIKVILPTPDVIKLYEAIVGPAVRQIENNMREIQTLTKLRDTLLPKLISGELRIVDLKREVSEDTAVGEVVEFPKKAKKDGSNANEQFKEAILVAGIVRGWGSQQYPLGNFRLQKAAYLIHRKAEHDTNTRRHAAGPYNPDMKYKGGIGIAKKNGYVQERTNGKFKGLIAGDAISAIDGYMSRYDFGDSLAWVLRTFQYKTKDELELLTTVDDAAQGLCAEGRAVNADAIITVIRDEPTWASKLEKSFFSKAHIEKAITELSQLFPQRGAS